MTYLLIALLAQVSDADVEAALKTYSKALASAQTDDAKLSAAFELLDTPHERTIKAAAKLLFDTEAVRLGVINSLAELDHPASVEALVAALPAHEKKPESLGALATALGRLGWESAAPRMNELLKKVGDEQVRDSLPQVAAALGKIGSVTSVEPLADLLVKLRQPRRAPWKGEGDLTRTVSAALFAITGNEVVDPNGFQSWWRDNKTLLLAKARLTYWNKKTHERQTIQAGEKAPPESVLVSQRVTDPPAPDSPAEKKRAKKKNKN